MMVAGVKIPSIGWGFDFSELSLCGPCGPCYIDIAKCYEILLLGPSI